MSVIKRLLRKYGEAQGGKDNSFGRGYHEVPPNLRNIQRFVTSSTKLLANHKVFPDQGVHMFTVKADHQFGILKKDLESLLRLGLIRIQSNDPGEISLYFSEETP